MNNPFIKIVIIVILFITPISVWTQEEIEIREHLWLNTEICDDPVTGDIFPLSNLEGNMTLDIDNINSDKKHSLFYCIKNYFDEQKDRLYYWDHIKRSHYRYDTPCQNLYYTDQYKKILFYGATTTYRDTIDNTIAYYTIPEGRWEVYYENDKNSKLKIKEVNIKKQQIIGEYTVWDKNGRLLYQTNADTIGCWYMRDFHPLGEVRVEGLYNNGLRDSIWTWYDTEGRVEVKELYKNGKMQKMLQPYIFKLIGFPHIPDFVIRENEDDKSITRQFINLRDTTIIVRDTVGINLYFGRYGYSPQKINISDNRLLQNGKRVIDVSFSKGTIYYDLMVMNDTLGDYYGLPSNINLLFNKTLRDFGKAHEVNKLFLPMMGAVHMSKVKIDKEKDGKIDFYLHYSLKEKKILKISGQSKSISPQNIKKIARLMEEDFKEKKIEIKDRESDDEVVYCITFSK